MEGNGRALVTGGAGFIGSHLIDVLIHDGYHVTVLDDFSSGQPRNLVQHHGSKSLRLVRGSVNDSTKVKKAMEDVEVVFHMAAVVSVAKSLTQPRLVDRVNAGGTLAVLDASRRSDVKRFVLASSAAVYGDKNRPPIGEGCPPAPVSPYGATKVSAEAHCSAFFRSYGVATVALRYFNVYGPRQTSGLYSGVMMRFAEAVTNGEPPTVYGDGKQTRDFVHIDDVVSATVAASEIREAEGQTFNVGVGRQTPIIELARLFLLLTPGAVAGIAHAEPRLGDIRASWADIRKARSILGYKPELQLKDGLKSFLSWYSEEHPGRKQRLSRRT